MSADVLVVEDHTPTRQSICEALREAGYQVRQAENGRSALDELRESPADVVVSDYRMSPVDGLGLLAEVRRTLEIPFILYSASADAEAVFRAGREGAFVFLEYPFRIDDQLVPTIEESLSQRSEGEQVGECFGIDRLVGSSAAMHRVRTLIRKVARSQATVLIDGETGTGKELVARAIHEESGRDPMVAIAVTELSDTLLESELFGHARGAFTGASGTRPGLFEHASGGTLFLDEIGDASLGLQAKILRALETSSIRPLGGDAYKSVDVRIVAATHRDLGDRVRKGEFREDLFYRINQVSIHIPPLRERAGDVPTIAQALIADLAHEARVQPPQLSADFLDSLLNHPWSGNVRQLRTVLQNVLLWWDGRSTLERSDLIETFSMLNRHLNPDDCLTSQRMIDAYRRCNGNQEAARRELGLSRGEWRYRWKRYELDVFRYRRR
jgi:DNA-binding NtrC family response regulator